MSDGFSLDLRNAEEQIDEWEAADGVEGVVLGVLDGETPDEEWLEELAAGKVLVLAVHGELNERAAGFAGPAKDAGATLMHFRGFLVAAPAGVSLDTSRL
ncbi:hypothetical protein EFA46_009715 [Halarchaeum sp. CBA1220]|uniref:Uncharacterized protein n=1 Tax=Halarchaeum grantii TaxID=1193105 RepID=A0A830F5V5_9EURY|nr:MULTISPECIES: DUF5779 family protein [Halarchaeum]QLC34470.1 hypothetical protein EFA46_009715 [Halarchaeum sp. CBA1220]GGL22512.1 hypothetical protein GCM10009037_02420 [Halarchaeum grantii]